MNDINRTVMVDIPGPTLEPDTIAHLTRYRPGGVILFKKNIVTTAQTRALTDHLRDLLGPDLLIAIDQEGGGVWRTTDLPAAPSAMSIGAANLGEGHDEQHAFEIGAMIARGMRAMGLNWNFAPVLDINNNPRNPVISDRSFGEDPRRVTLLALEYAAGLASEGVAACGKHFPGHGDTHLDSHLHLPTVTRNLEGLEEYELVPFRAAVRSGTLRLPSIMTAHIIYPALDPDWPATLSRKILTGLLRERGQYEGVIVTDSMGMKAIDDNYGRGEAAAMSLNAGADMIEALGSREVQVQTLTALEAAAQNGTVPAETIARALERLHALAAAHPSTPRDYPAATQARDRALAVDAWGRGITLHNQPAIPKPGSGITLVSPDEAPEDNVSEVGVRGADLARHLEGVYRVKPILYPARNAQEALGAVREARANGEVIVFATTGRYRLREDARALADAAKPDLHLALWNAYCTADVPAPAILTYGCRTEALEALVRVLRGEARATGKAPVKLEAR